jgi:hypothetical protein
MIVTAKQLERLFIIGSPDCFSSLLDFRICGVASEYEGALTGGRVECATRYFSMWMPNPHFNLRVRIRRVGCVAGGGRIPAHWQLRRHDMHIAQSDPLFA